jgi:hypothetical protein
MIWLKFTTSATRHSPRTRRDRGFVNVAFASGCASQLVTEDIFPDSIAIPQRLLHQESVNLATV